MGGLAPKVGKPVSWNSQLNKATNYLEIPLKPIPGLAYMKEHDMLSKNPAGSGGVGRGQFTHVRCVGACPDPVDTNWQSLLLAINFLEAWLANPSELTNYANLEGFHAFFADDLKLYTQSKFGASGRFSTKLAAIAEYRTITLHSIAEELQHNFVYGEMKAEQKSDTVFNLTFPFSATGQDDGALYSIWTFDTDGNISSVQTSDSYYGSLIFANGVTWIGSSPYRAGAAGPISASYPTGAWGWEPAAGGSPQQFVRDASAADTSNAYDPFPSMASSYPLLTGCCYDNNATTSDCKGCPTSLGGTTGSNCGAGWSNVCCTCSSCGPQSEYATGYSCNLAGGCLGECNGETDGEVLGKYFISGMFAGNYATFFNTNNLELSTYSYWGYNTGVDPQNPSLPNNSGAYDAPVLDIKDLSGDSYFAYDNGGTTGNTLIDNYPRFQIAYANLPYTDGNIPTHTQGMACTHFQLYPPSGSNGDFTSSGPAGNFHDAFAANGYKIGGRGSAYPMILEIKRGRMTPSPDKSSIYLETKKYGGMIWYHSGGYELNEIKFNLLDTTSPAGNFNTSDQVLDNWSVDGSGVSVGTLFTCKDPTDPTANLAHGYRVLAFNNAYDASYNTSADVPLWTTLAGSSISYSTATGVELVSVIDSTGAERVLDFTMSSDL